MGKRAFYLKWKQGRQSRVAIATAPTMNDAAEKLWAWLGEHGEKRPKQIDIYAADLDLTADPAPGGTENG